MSYNPAEKLKIKVEAEINGVMTEITSRTRAAGAVGIKHAYSNGAIQAETSICELTIGNDDGWLTEGDPRSPWDIGRGTPIQVSLTAILPTDAERFTGKIEEMFAVYPGGKSSAMRITATGSLGEAAQNDDPADSPLFRSMSGLSPGDFVPHAYWPLEDEPFSTSFASATADGSAVTPAGTIAFGTDETTPGSQPLPMFEVGSAATFIIPPYDPTGQWVVQFLIRVPTFPVPRTVFAKIETSGSTYVRYEFNLDSNPPLGTAPALVVDSYEASGATFPSVISLDGFLPTDAVPADFTDKHVMISIFAAPPASSFPDDWMFSFAYDTGSVKRFGGLESGIGHVGSGPGVVTSITLYGGAQVSLGHLALFTDPTFDLEVESPNYNASAMGGWPGEQAHVRVARLCHEAGLPVTIIGDASARVGPQRTATLFNLLLDCERADVPALLSDSLDAEGFSFRTGRSLYNQQPAVAVTQGALTQDFAPIWDNQRTTNDVTVSRTGGSSARATDEAHVTRTRRRLRTRPQRNLYSDEMLPDHASWGVFTGTIPGPRYADGGINLRNEHGAKLAEAVLALRPGDRFTAADVALPTQHPPGGVDQIVIGWTEYLDAYEWLLHPVLVPALPYNVTGRWELMSHELHSALSDSALTADIATTDPDQPLLETAGLGDGYSITINNEEMQVTAVAASLPSFGAAGSAVGGDNVSITPGIPAGVATGDLLLAFVAIRNSGTGTPDTPAGYTRLPVFPSASNAQLFAKIATSAGEAAPLISFTGGVAGATTTAQMCRLPGKWHDVNNIIPGDAAASCLSTTAQDITYPGLSTPDADNCIILYLGWKQTIWTSVATIAGATEIGDVPSTPGDDQGLVWDYVVQTTAAAIPSDVFTVTGGVSAISRGAVVPLRCDYQTATVSRSVNSVSAAHAAGDDVTATQPTRWALV